MTRTPPTTPDTTSTAPPFTFGGAVAEAVTTKTQVHLSSGDRADLARAVTYFSHPDQKNTAVLSFSLATDEDAADYRAKIQLYADTHDLSAGFPKFVDGHMSNKGRDTVDESTGKVTKPSKWIPANKYPKHWNVGPNVTFRLAAHRAKSDVDTATVTVTSVADEDAGE